MGVLKKLKDIFYDEVEEEVIEKEEDKPRVTEVDSVTETLNLEDDLPIKKHDTSEIEIPRFEEEKKLEEKPKEEKKDEEIPERELFQSKKTFNFPILNDEEVEIPKSRSNVNVMEMEKKKEQEKVKQHEEMVNINTTFKPSPVISPIYGILDKNFKKEDIINKNKQNEEIIKQQNSSFVYDTVRKKAYGSLQDDLEDTLATTTRIEAEKILNEVDNIEKELDKLDESTPRDNINGLVDDINNTAEMTVGEMEEQTKRIDLEPEEETREIDVKETSRIEKYKSDSEPKKKTISDVGDKTLEHDLFNLIDSMYEEEE